VAAGNEKLAARGNNTGNHAAGSFDAANIGGTNMKVNAVLLLIALALAALISFGFFVWNQGEGIQFVIMFFSALSSFLTLGGILAVSFNRAGTANIRMLSIACFIENLVLNVIFSFIQPDKFAVYIIISGISLLLYILIFYSIYRSIVED
jgi:hypothetical protein